MNLTGNELITVCDKCLRACCWQGEFMCDDARGAGTTEKTVQWLRETHRVRMNITGLESN